jgi:type II secretory pathway component PulM
MNAWNTWLSQRSPREQIGIQWALGLVLVLVVWQGAVSPALQVLQSSGAQRARLAQQTALMQALQQQAQQLRQQTRISPEQAAQSLQQMAQALGGQVKFNRQGERVTLDFKALSPQALAELLTQARSQAHAQVQEAHTQFKPAGWEGQLVFALPNKP